MPCAAPVTTNKTSNEQTTAPERMSAWSPRKYLLPRPAFITVAWNMSASETNRQTATSQRLIAVHGPTSKHLISFTKRRWEAKYTI